MRTCPFCAEEIQEAAIVCKHCRRDLPTGATTATATAERSSASYAPPSKSAPGAKSAKKRPSNAFILILLLILLVFIIYRVQQGAGTGGVAGLVTPPQVVRIAGFQQIEVAAGGIQRVQWDVSATQPNCRLTGHIQVTDGGNRDVQVFVLTADDYANFVNGHPSRAFFQTQKTTAVSLDVRTSVPGPKVLAISNAFSVMTAKKVELRDVQATCQ